MQITLDELKTLNDESQTVINGRNILSKRKKNFLLFVNEKLYHGTD